MLLRPLFHVLIFIHITKSVEVTTFSGYSYTSNPLTLTTMVHVHDQVNNATTANIGMDRTTFSPTTSDLQNTTKMPVDVILECSGLCSNLSASCYDCNTSDNCVYGQVVDFPCRVKDTFHCTGNRTVVRKFHCQYCFLTKPGEDYTCEQTNTSCNVAATPRQRVKMNCTVKSNVFCLGKRKFSKMTYCNWTSGYKWSTAVILSITLGGFGVDRFYLGYWREGLGKLFSFGGLGVWTLIDIVLIATSYLGPSDGSLYIY